MDGDFQKIRYTVGDRLRSQKALDTAEQALAANLRIEALLTTHVEEDKADHKDFVRKSSIKWLLGAVATIVSAVGAVVGKVLEK